MKSRRQLTWELVFGSVLFIAANTSSHASDQIVIIAFLLSKNRSSSHIKPLFGQKYLKKNIILWDYLQLCSLLFSYIFPTQSVCNKQLHKHKNKPFCCLHLQSLIMFQKCNLSVVFLPFMFVKEHSRSFHVKSSPGQLLLYGP